jgi:hypothetical protein
VATLLDWRQIRCEVRRRGTAIDDGLIPWGGEIVLKKAEGSIWASDGRRFSNRKFRDARSTCSGTGNCAGGFSKAAATYGLDKPESKLSCEKIRRIGAQIRGNSANPQVFTEITTCHPDNWRLIRQVQRQVNDS